MTFDIENIARKYINERYTKESIPEREKYVQDWIRKLPTARLTVADFKKRVGELADKKLVDMGCGNGAYIIAYTEAGAEVTGVEVEKELYEITKQNLLAHNISANAILYDGYKLPFTNDYFDYANSLSVLEHTDDPKIFLMEILRVVKPGGKFYLAFPNKLWYKETHTGLYFLSYLPKFLQEKYISLFKRNPLKENNLHFYSLFDLKKFIKEISCDGYRWSIVNEDGDAKSGMKYLVKKILATLGLSYKAFLPHVSVILIKVK